MGVAVRNNLAVEHAGCKRERERERESELQYSSVDCMLVTSVPLLFMTSRFVLVAYHCRLLEASERRFVPAQRSSRSQGHKPRVSLLYDYSSPSSSSSTRGTVLEAL